MASPMNDLREELRRAASPAAVNAWRGAQADFANAVRYWDKPLSHEVERPSRQPRAPSEACGSGKPWAMAGRL